MTSAESRLMESLQLAGRIIMENGGETYRVEETITRMGHAFGLEDVESFAVPSGLFISFRTASGENETSVLRIRRGSTDLTRVDEVNSISRLVEARQLNCEEAAEQLRAIRLRSHTLPKPLLMLAAAISSGGFAVMFGGGTIDFALSGAVAAFVQLLLLFVSRFHVDTFADTLLGSFLSTLIPLIIHLLTGIGLTDAIIAGALMPMLPGLAMTNAVQDAMRGDMISGLSHGMSALLTAGLVAAGALMANFLCLLVGGGAA